MIVRILTEGQYDLPAAFMEELNRIDNELVRVVEDGDGAQFQALLAEMLDLVRTKGKPVPLDELVESDLVLPEPDLTLEEARGLFTGEGILPG